MRAPARLAAFAAALAAVGAVAALVGAAVDPVHDGGAPAHAGDGHGGPEASGGHGEAPGGDAPSGLSVASGGLTLSPAAATLPRGRSAVLAFRILGPDGSAVRTFEEEHGRPMHLILVRRDMAGYRHLHPRMGADGTWRTPVRLDRAGAYRAFADFRVDGARHTLGGDLMVAGPFAPRPLPAARARAAGAGQSVTLSAAAPRAGRRLALDFHVRAPAGPVRLQPYLGARGHLVALREGDLAYLHVHPGDGAPAPDRVSFSATFPSAGRYRLFLQTRHGDRVRTVAHTLEVTP